MPLLLNNDDVAQLLNMEDSVRALDDTVREWAQRDAHAIPRHNFFAPAEQPGHYFQFGIMSGGSKHQQMYCLRILDDVLHYERHGDLLTREKYCIEPGTYCGLLFLFSTKNAEPLAIIPDGLIQHMRVAGETAVGANLLAVEDATIIGMLGSGGMARSFAQAIKVVRNIKKIRVFSPNKAHRERYAAEMSQDLGVEVAAFDTPREAVHGTDIVCLCTDSLRPVMSTDWLEPGMLVCAVGGGGGRGDVGGDLSRFDRTFAISTDDLVSLKDEGGGYMIGYSYYAGSKEDFAGIPQEAWWQRPRAKQGIDQILDVINGKTPGRSSKDEIILLAGGGYNSVGFVSLAAVAYRKAKELGMGRALPLDWFTQKLRD